MSLILEALRRSEAERRRGHAPSLFDDSLPRRERARPAWPIALAGLALGVLIAGGAAWWLQREAPEAVSPAVATAAEAPPAQPAFPTAMADPPPTPAAPVARPEPAPTATPTVRRALPATPEAPPPISPDARLGPAAGDLAIGDLPPPTRAALPPLRLSMHVYADDAAQRFAIVDGVRLREGDTLGDLQVVEIRRDGLRLAWQGHTLWLPR